MSDKETKKIIKKTFSGIVVGDKMDKTITVKVVTSKIHPLYKKHFKTSKNYKVHDSQNKFHAEDKVDFIECRPLSKDKRWKVIY
ncbi:MAG: 30S ribosomal protein S17 [bacterium]